MDDTQSLQDGIQLLNNQYLILSKFVDQNVKYVFYPKPSNQNQILNFNERYIFYYDYNYIYTFDMELKQITMLNAFTDPNLYGYISTPLQQFDFYTLDNNKINLKKSESIIDQLIIKSMQENTKYLGKKIYLLNPINHEPQVISTLDTNIVKYEYCFQQQIIVAQTSNFKIYSISNQDKINIAVTDSISDLSFYLKCDDEMMCQNFNVFQSGAFQSNKYLFNKRQSDTSLYYDFYSNILIGITGTIKQINIINIPGNQQLFTYQTISKFSKNSVYYYNQKKSLIIPDNSPTLYLLNYLTQNTITYNIDIQKCPRSSS
ncbi:hypothetical protein ABPG72_007183 [Tetrahymena utriculariae]